MADEVHDCSEMAKVPGSSASTSSFCKGVIINYNSGKQGDVVTGVGRDFIKDVKVGGDFIKDVTVGGDFDFIKDVHVAGDFIKDVHVAGHFIKDVHVAGHFINGEKKKLPPTPPRFVVLKAKYNGKCLRLTENDDGDDFPAGYLKFEGRGMELASPQAKFELEIAKIGHEFVHIRCCYNNKYLVRYGATAWIVAAADKPEEDESKMSCTLFELEWVNKSGREFRFRHIQRKSYACVWRCTGTCRDSTVGRNCHGGLCIGLDEADAYTVVPWESLETVNKAVVQVPKFVALKKMLKNTKYLSLTTTNDPSLPAGIMDFEGEEVAKFEIERANSEKGLVHIRCCENNKYLVRDSMTCICCHEKFNNPYLIVAAADKPEEDEYKISCTLFEPELYDESGEPKFRFYHIHLGTRRYACTCRSRSGLHGDSNEPHKDACDVFRVVDLDGSG